MGDYLVGLAWATTIAPLRINSRSNYTRDVIFGLLESALVDLVDCCARVDSSLKRGLLSQSPELSRSNRARIPLEEKSQTKKQTVELELVQWSTTQETSTSK